ncbi:hypothetical protein [Methylocaldum sp.]|uniref:hypothetical protein n=1 Tax=Methylocaldum sp. TaxID=1969727 RepID=UPI002D50EFB2|nr:hypothetical protein [Methylocaldum sp.]HYE35379.1 hypothetical protein [Methylocaldum sp.]
MSQSQQRAYCFKSEIIELFGADGRSAIFRAASDSKTGYQKLAVSGGRFMWLSATAGEVRTIERALTNAMTERERMEQAADQFWTRQGAMPKPGLGIDAPAVPTADPNAQAAWDRVLGR